MIGRRIGQYEIVSELGRGGMGVVYLGRHLTMDRQVAVKALTPEYAQDERLRAGLVAEQRTLDELRHSNIVALHDIHVEGSEVFLVFEHIAGRTIAQVLEQDGPLPAMRTAAIAQQLLSALAFTHARDVLHLDVKPANVMLTLRDAKLLDFGIARARSVASAGQSGKKRDIVGSPAYIAPEMWKGEEATPASDIYSLGLTLFEALTGQPAVVGGNDILSWYHAHLETEVPDVREHQPNVPPWLAEAVFRATRRDPTERFEHGKAMLKEFRRFQTVGVELLLPAEGEAGAQKTLPRPIVLPPQPPERSDEDKAALASETVRLAAPEGRRFSPSWLAAALAVPALVALVLFAFFSGLWAGKPTDTPAASLLLDVSNRMAGPIEVACVMGVGQAAQRSEQSVAAGQALVLPLAARPATCLVVDAGGERLALWSSETDAPGQGHAFLKVQPSELTSDEEEAVRTILLPTDPGDATEWDGIEEEEGEPPIDEEPDGPPMADLEPDLPPKEQPRAGPGPKKEAAEQEAPALSEATRTKAVVAECGGIDEQTLWRKAETGALGIEDEVCLEHAIETADRQTTRERLSIILMRNAQGSGDRSRFERLLRRHLEDISRQDPALCLQYAALLRAHGKQRDLSAAILWATRALDDRARFPTQEVLKYTLQGHELRTRAAYALWTRAANQYDEDPSDANAEEMDRLRYQAREFSREWLDFARAAGVDHSEAMNLCRSAAGTADACR